MIDPSPRFNDQAHLYSNKWLKLRRIGTKPEPDQSKNKILKYGLVFFKRSRKYRFSKTIMTQSVWWWYLTATNLNASRKEKKGR
jgi:hypothetical protein